MGHKVAEATCNINNGFDPGAANEHAVQQWFKKFYKVDESLDHEEPSGRPQEVDKNQLRATIKAVPLTN